MRRRLIAAMCVAAWFVVTWSGQKVAGPFTLLDACAKVAKIMNAQDAAVSDLCRYF